MHKIAESVGLLFNVDCEVKFEEGYPPTMNSPKLRASVEQAINAANLEVIDKPLPFLFGEDFSFYGQQLAPNYFCICRYSKRRQRFCDWTSYISS